MVGAQSDSTLPASGDLWSEIMENVRRYNARCDHRDSVLNFMVDHAKIEGGVLTFRCPVAINVDTAVFALYVSRQHPRFDEMFGFRVTTERGLDIDSLRREVYQANIVRAASMVWWDWRSGRPPQTAQTIIADWKRVKLLDSLQARR
jgi:hypothetical protein